MAAVGAALLTAGTGAVAFGQTGSSNTGGSATNSQTATGGSNAPSLTGATISVTIGSSNKGGTKIAANTKSGRNSANASNRGSAKGGSVNTHF